MAAKTRKREGSRDGRQTDAGLPRTGIEILNRAISTGGVEVEVSGVRHGFLSEKGGTVVRALWDFDLTISAGRFVSIVGPSGCGKTTLLTLIGGLDTARAGEVKVGGRPVVGPSETVAYMLARDALLPWRTVKRNVEFGMEARGVSAMERAERSQEWIQRVGLTGFADWPIGKLSQGMRQRVAIARTLAMSPRCILMDEPFAALDAQTRSVLQQEFLGLWEREQPTVVLITHDLTEAILLGDRVVLMSYRPGRVLVDVEIDLPRPRAVEAELSDPTFAKYYDLLATQLREEVRKGMAN